MPVLALLLAVLGLPGPAAASEVAFVACDNGLRCYRPPCPARDVVILPSGTRYARLEPVLRLPAGDRRRVDEADALYHGSIVFGGTLAEGPPAQVVARRILREATAAESALCRRVR